MSEIGFKDWLNLEEGMLSTAYNFVKSKISNLLNNIKSFVIRSKKVEKGSVSFSFPKQSFGLSEGMYLKKRLELRLVRKYSPEKLEFLLSSLNNNSNAFQIFGDDGYPMSPEEAKETIQHLFSKPNVPIGPVTPLERVDPIKAGFLFEIEVYLAIKNKGYPGIEEKLPKNYETLKSLLQKFYEEIKKEAEGLAEVIVTESKKVMPCVDAVVFSGGIGGSRGGRKDPADLKMVCKEQYFGYSIKHYKPQNRKLTIANLGSNPLISVNDRGFLTEIKISNAQEFADFLNKMVSERNNTRVAIGGKDSVLLQDLLSADFEMNPHTSQYVPKHDGPVQSSNYNDNDDSPKYYSFGQVTIAIIPREKSYRVDLFRKE